MTIKRSFKKYTFVFMLFLVQELFMNLIGEYSKTFLSKSIVLGKYIVDMLLTLFLYDLFVFTAAFVIFFMYFKKQALLYDFKRKLLRFVAVVAGYEGCKLIAYLIVRDKTQSIYFILGNAFLVVVQITIFRLFNGIDNNKEDKKPGIGKKNIIAASALTVAATVFIIIYEISIKNSHGSDVYISGRFFVCGFLLAIFTAVIQTVFFGGVMNEELPETVSVKSQSILLIGLAGMAVILWFVKMLLPEGAMTGIHGSSTEGAERTSEGNFGSNYHQFDLKRVCDHEEKMVYFKQTTDVYYGKEKIISSVCNDPSKISKVKRFYFDEENINGLIQKDLMIVYKTSSGDIEYCIFGKKQSKGYDSSIYERALKA